MNKFEIKALQNKLPNLNILNVIIANNKLTPELLQFNIFYEYLGTIHSDHVNFSRRDERLKKYSLEYKFNLISERINKQISLLEEICYKQDHTLKKVSDNPHPQLILEPVQDIFYSLTNINAINNPMTDLDSVTKKIFPLTKNPNLYIIDIFYQALKEFGVDAAFYKRLNLEKISSTYT